MIAKAILRTTDRKMLLSDIYEYIYDTYPFFHQTKCSWRNSIRYNLTVHECFMKNEQAPNGRGYYWSIHPACLDDFLKGDYNRKQARLRIKRNNKQLEANIQMSQQNRGHVARNPLSELKQIQANTNSDRKGWTMNGNTLQGCTSTSIARSQESTSHYHSTPRSNIRSHPYSTQTSNRHPGHATGTRDTSLFGGQVISPLHNNHRYY